VAGHHKPRVARGVLFSLCKRSGFSCIGCQRSGVRRGGYSYVFFKASAAIYETIAFTTEAKPGTELSRMERSCSGWKSNRGYYDNRSRNAPGLIERIEPYHRPLAIVLAVASELEHRLGETLGAKLFARARILVNQAPILVTGGTAAARFASFWHLVIACELGCVASTTAPKL
jgi:hypothetical protein